MSDTIIDLKVELLSLDLVVTETSPIELISTPLNIEGEKGDQGEQGIQGLSAYEIAVNNGFVGTEQEWLNSLSNTNSSYYVDIENNQTIGGIKTFIDTPVFSNGIDMSYTKITNVFNPTNLSDVATKEYVDTRTPDLILVDGGNF